MLKLSSVCITADITIGSPKTKYRYIYFIIKYGLNVKISLKCIKNANFNFAEISGSWLGTGNYWYEYTRDYSS